MFLSFKVNVALSRDDNDSDSGESTSTSNRANVITKAPAPGIKRGKSIPFIDASLDLLSPIHEANTETPSAKTFFCESTKNTYPLPNDSTVEDKALSSPLKYRPSNGIPPIVPRLKSKTPSFNSRTLVRNESKLVMFEGLDDSESEMSTGCALKRWSSEENMLSMNSHKNVISAITPDDNISQIVKGSDDMLKSQKKIEYIVEAIQEVASGSITGGPSALQALLINTPRFTEKDPLPISLSRQNSAKFLQISTNSEYSSHSQGSRRPLSGGKTVIVNVNVIAT